MGDWRLTYDPAGVHTGADLAFGAPLSGYRVLNTPSPDSGAIENDDTNVPRSDGIMMGIDTRGGTTVPFDILVNGRTEAQGRELYSALQRAWRGDAVRSTPGAVAALRAPTGRRAFGRPRRFFGDGRFRRNGRYDVTADFATVDDLWYGDEQEATVFIVPALGGGLVAPLQAPLSTTASSNRSQVFEIGGELPTWATVEIAGDITRPEVEILGVMRQEFDITLAYDQSITADGRPWRRSVLRQDGASVAGALTRTSTDVLDMLIPPGRHEIVLRGASQSGTARATVRWSKAFTSY